ncbi:zinc finger protein ZOP1 [Salvia miltiorrhiza]|uniref:zinc finger protein ZOP1 n=1 Tax=Salvia miltiorrhiza TaxID=226208 RepID=UPI0025AD91E0|nr:zinc finger protein ZOP1 [Salvia miltiorrhiza]XP_057787444.1 zinc finger protein ZOP1 [Salvia miltiorrhiza]
MTEFWVSQGNKWCDTCKIYISNNPASIRNHELGQRHKDSVTKRLNTMREDKAKKDKEQKQAAKVLEQIEAKAKRSYQKDLASFQEARESNAQALIGEDLETADGSSMPGEWEQDSSSGYYYNQTTGFHYDPNSGFYYSDSLGKWVPQEEALAAFRASPRSIKTRPNLGKPPSASENISSAGGSTSESGPPPGRLISTPLNPMRSVKGAKSSSVAVKRKRPDEKPKAVSKEEAAALKAREAARKRVEQREKPLLGLYRP